MELEGIRDATVMDTTRENIVLPPPMETKKMSSLIPSNILPWADRVEHSTPSLRPGYSLCPDGVQNPSISPLEEPQMNQSKKHQDAQQQEFSDSARFFFILKTVNTFSTVSSFLIEKAITSSIGQVKTIRKMRSGDLFLEITSAKQSAALKNLSKMAHFDITVVPHNSLNFSRGVISAADLLNLSPDEIQENMQDQKVCNVRRITIRRDGQVLNTKHLILAFSMPELPQSIKAAYLHCPVRPYIPNPLRCFQCQRFGHSKTVCRGQPTCSRCAEIGHDSADCKTKERCVKCKGDHSLFSRNCPT
ncbi:uncharacterized protein TNCV_2690611 [Trichonephila clavipes]|uniref:CCHC-type domain-containing protein n=1 Tax=Trichonephila clavipes TaxID=2585209 RepID=A0A8X7BA85_TRICX|nr:uncharacterized protein TNCV_2690611 [Trichonephila clavipes]